MFYKILYNILSTFSNFCCLNNLEFISETPQESEGVTYAFKIHKNETRINWNMPGKIVDRFIRGLSEKPGAWSMINGSRVKILKSKIH